MAKSKIFTWQKMIGALAALLFLTGFGTTWYNGTVPTIRGFSPAELAGQKYIVVLASSPAQLEQGLSRRRRIGADGMLFLFPSRQQTAFWMYQMRFPLDFIWIDGEKIVQLDQQVPSPVSFSTSSSAVATVRPTQPVTAVLEVPAGFIQAKNLRLGDTFQLEEKTVLRAW